MRHNTAVIILGLALFSACADSDLQKVGKTLLVTAKAVGEVQSTVIQANNAKLISDDTTRAILEVCLKVDLAGKQAVAVTRQISKLDNPSRQQLLQILKPIVASLQTSLTLDVLLIKDPDTRIKVQSGLLLLETSINSVILILAVGG